MDKSRILEVIGADPALQALRDAGNFGLLAEQINAQGHTKVTASLGGIGTILSVLGPVAGAALLDQLESLAAVNSAVKWAFVLINRGDLDFGDAATRNMIDQLVTDPAANAALKAVAEVPDVVAPHDITAALGV